MTVNVCDVAFASKLNVHECYGFYNMSLASMYIYM